MIRAKLIIYEQEAPLSIKRSAFGLYEHELDRIDPATSKPFTSRKALANVLRWIAWQKARHDADDKTLTLRQRQLLYLLVVEGLTQKEMALALKISEKTIKRHFENIRQRIGVDSTYQVVALAVEHGWVNAPKLDD